MAPTELETNGYEKTRRKADLSQSQDSNGEEGTDVKPLNSPEHSLCPNIRRNEDIWGKTGFKLVLLRMATHFWNGKMGKEKQFVARK